MVLLRNKCHKQSKEERHSQVYVTAAQLRSASVGAQADI